MPKKTKAIKKTDRKKAWLRKPKSSSYKVETREVNKTVLVVGEGQTERLYFESFPVLTLSVKVVDLQGQSKLKLIEATDSIIEHSETTYDVVWCVFDMDVKQGAQEYSAFDNAIKSGLDKGYKVAYSNDCFELWFYLHYQNTDQANRREFYFQQLGQQWNFNYEKEGKRYERSREYYARLENDEKSSQKEAIRRAKKLYSQQSALKYHEQNPVTLVYQLVEFLNENSRK